MAYGDLKVRNLIWNTGSGDNTVVLSTLATQSYVTTNFAPKASPAFTGTATGVNLTLSGDLTVNGTTTTIDTTTLQVEDKNIEIGKVSSPSDTTADGGGWTLKGATDKTFNWVNSTDAWTSSEHIHVGDNKKLLVGTGSDLQIYHDGSNSYVRDVGTGTLWLDTNGNDISLISDGSVSDGKMGRFWKDGAVELYYNNSLKFNTNPGGIKVSGNIACDGDNQKLILGAGDDLQLWHDGFTSNIVDTSGTLNIGVNNFVVKRQGLDETMLYCQANAAVSLYYDNTVRAATTNTGFSVTGTVSDSKGDLRKIIQNTQGSAYTLVAGDAGKHILASGNITIPNSVFAAGDGVVIVNNTSGDLTITSTITNLYLGSDGSTGNKKLASRCTCTVLFTSGTAGYISGGGLTAA